MGGKRIFEVGAERPFWPVADRLLMTSIRKSRLRFYKAVMSFSAPGLT